MDLTVSIEIEGEQIVAGKIEYKNNKNARFIYDESFVDKGYAPISISLPIQKEPFSEMETRNFFEGLLPEGFTRRSIAGIIRADEDDYLSLLKALGNECIGAIRVFETDSEVSVWEYEKLTMNKLKRLASEGAVESAKILTGTRLSLAGASGKVGLAYDGKGYWYLPHGLAPSTHIVKQSHVRLHDIVINECLIMRAAKNVGLNASNCIIINSGKGSDGEVLLASERFDRLYENPVFEKGKFKKIKRLHQEDFAQILSINSLNKYEREGDHYLKSMFDVIRKYSAEPIEDSMELWKRLVFDFLTGNADCHLKNFSMLYSENLKSMRLAPMYDALSTRIYDETTRDFAFNINGKYRIDEITKDDFIAASMDAGIAPKKAKELFDEVESKLQIALDNARDELLNEGYGKAIEIRKKIKY